MAFINEEEAKTLWVEIAHTCFPASSHISIVAILLLETISLLRPQNEPFVITSVITL